MVGCDPVSDICSEQPLPAGPWSLPAGGGGACILVFRTPAQLSSGLWRRSLGEMLEMSNLADLEPENLARSRVGFQLTFGQHIITDE